MWNFNVKLSSFNVELPKFIVKLKCEALLWYPRHLKWTSNVKCLAFQCEVSCVDRPDHENKNNRNKKFPLFGTCSLEQSTPSIAWLFSDLWKFQKTAENLLVLNLTDSRRALCVPMWCFSLIGAFSTNVCILMVCIWYWNFYNDQVWNKPRNEFGDWGDIGLELTREGLGGRQPVGGPVEKTNMNILESESPASLIISYSTTV